jgi:hypothetical protein
VAGRFPCQPCLRLPNHRPFPPRRQCAALLGSSVWTGGGPGLMRAASLGGLAAGVAVGGIRISREAGSSVRTVEVGEGAGGRLEA